MFFPKSNDLKSGEGFTNSNNINNVDMALVNPPPSELLFFFFFLGPFFLGTQ